MKVLGLITEYNPFHNGHLYHLKKSIEITGATHTIAVMSGNFLQRGEPALLHKWERAKMAVKGGVDLVIELPTAYACATAEYFSYGAIKILDSLGIVDVLCFGSERGRLDELDHIAELLLNPPQGLRELLQHYLKEGLSFPAARSQAVSHYLDRAEEFSAEVRQEIRGVMKSPNNILSIEYLKALKGLNSTITPATILRVKADYHSTSMEAGIVSATAIREHLKGGGALSAVKKTVPATTFEILEEAFKVGLGPIYSYDFQQMILSIIRRSSLEELQGVFDVKEGLENKIFQCAKHHHTLEELYSCIKSKRYPLTRVQRIMMHHLLGITAKDMEDFQRAGGPQYARILAFNDKGRTLLKSASQISKLPIINKLSQFNPPNEACKRMLDLDIRATDIYRLAIKNPQLAAQPLDYTQSPIYLEE